MYRDTPLFPCVENEEQVEDANIETENKLESSALDKQTNGFHDSNASDQEHKSVKTSDDEDDSGGGGGSDTDKCPNAVQNAAPLEPSKSSTQATPAIEEEEKIQEYLSRSDTAVIFPQPVSDHDDDDASHTGDSVNNTDDECVLKCMHCNDSFSRASQLRDHMRTAHSDKPLKYMCPKCEETFLLKSQLEKHLALHSPTSQSCKVCNKTFANVYRLQRHMISHDESTDLRKFKCEQCGKAFKFKHHLKEHIRIHSGEKPFECSNCGKRFSHSGSYSSHMTSKKCWVMNIKNRRIDRNGNSESISAFSSTNKNGHNNSNITLQNSGSLQPHFVQFSHRNPSLPTYYSPQINGNTAFIPYHMYPHKDSPAGRAASITNQTIAHSNSKLTLSQQQSLSKVSSLSPDVNSNTEPLSMVITKIEKVEGLAQGVIKKEKEESPAPNSDTSKPNERGQVNKGPLKDASIKCEDSEDSLILQNGNSENGLDTPPSSSVEGRDVDLTCRFCALSFKSPVDLHQHERYLCKLNKDIVHRVASLELACNSPSSTTSSDTNRRETPNGSIENGTDEDEDELLKDEGSSDKKFRMRSLFSDEQQQILKAYYKVNPRPRKYDLMKIGNEIGFSKRVVQVWFQNMRARDRKKGKEIQYFPSMARFKHQDDNAAPVPSSWNDQVKSNSSYIPVVPQHYNNTVQVRTAFPSFPAHSHSKSNGQNSTSENRDALYNGQEQPLDLSLKREPPQAHSGHLTTSYSSPPPPLQSFDNQVLNLSCRSTTANDVQSSGKSTTRVEGSFQESAIYNYIMKQKNLVNKPLDSASPKGALHPSPIPPPPPPPPTQHLTMPNQSIETPPPETEDESNKKVVAVKFSPKVDEDSSMSAEDSNDSTENHSLVIDESKLDQDEEENNNHGDEEDEDEDEDNDYEDQNRLTNGTLDSSHNSSLANLSMTSEEEQDSCNDGERKLKRLRKKSWRQVESEEVQLELEDSITPDEDQPHRKKRRSWKNHKVDVEEGMYACDQCDKMFNKQSSLARHKYEHSGARPFVCDVCGKAFKHKHHLTEHKRLHSGEKPFQCKKCGKRFSHSGSFSQHMNHRYKYCKPPKPDED